MIGLDTHAIKELRIVIAEPKAAGAAVFVGTHMLESIDVLRDRTVIMKNGRV